MMNFLNRESTKTAKPGWGLGGSFLQGGRAGLLVRLCNRVMRSSLPALAIVAGTAMALAQDATGCGNGNCTDTLRGKVYDDSQTLNPPPPANAEKETPGDKGDIAFSISVDGEPLVGHSKPVDAQRKADLALEDADIQVKFDGLDTKTILNVSTIPPRRAYQSGEAVEFLASWNYPAWIDHAEIRIYEEGTERDSAPLEKIPVSTLGAAKWQFPLKGPDNLTYVLRVYDKQGRYDETTPLSLMRAAPGLQPHDPALEAVAPGYGEDRTARRNIPVYGGVVTVYGRNVPGQHAVTVLGDPVPVDPNGSFVVQRILPPGDNDVDVSVLDDAGKGMTFNRAINIPTNDWFYVALADLTVGYKTGDNQIEDVKPGEFDDVYTKGRLAFYLKGKIKGRYLLTAAADTGEDDIQDMFKGLDSKDPRQLLRRLDPDDYYPIYGDDSTAIEDAPTRGKFYVRLERGDSYVMWGNFKAEIGDTEYLRNERALYGASAVYRSEAATTFGERKSQVKLYAAQPGTLPQRDVLRGTGGSAYFLKRQDITVGSETVTVEIRNSVSGLVMERRTLRYGFDYDIDYAQGIIILSKPLSSSTGIDEVVRDGALGGNAVYLVVNYEYTPAAGDVDGYVYGGRAEQWVGDHVRVGVTGMNEKTGPADQQMYGADIQLRKSEKTYLEAEVARSHGPGFGTSTSYDGGLTLTDNGVTSDRKRSGMAYRIAGKADMEELTGGALKGSVGAYYEQRQKGFSTLDDDVTESERLAGANAEVQLSDRLTLGAAYDEQKTSGGKQDRAVSGDLTYKFDEHWTGAVGVKNSKREGDAFDKDRTGSRTDVGARLTHNWDDNNLAYVFGQTTVSRSGGRQRGDRIGVGGKKQITEKIAVEAEISEGATGIGGLAGVDYAPTADDHYYLGYRLDPDRSDAEDYSYDLQGSDLGQIVGGATHRFNEQWTARAEDNYDLFGRRRSLTQTYGVDYTPDALWTLSGGIEVGTIYDDTIDEASGEKNSDFDRKAFSLAAGYKNENGLSGKLRGEARFETSEDGTRDRNTYLLSGGVNVKISEDWQAIGAIDAVISDKTSDTILDGDYIEGSIGYAYRPVNNDRLNALFKYTFLYDLPGPDQVNVDGDTLGPSQRSHILSADVSYDVNQLLTIGAKYGFRIGETKERVDGSWELASAHLGILRADLNIVNNWDFLMEGRVLYTPGTETADWGALAAVYRHLGENFKLGVGYNFGIFSDDLRDLTYDDQGFFVNAIGQF